MIQCRFCEIYEKKEWLIYESNYFFAIFDVFPVSPGHVEIIPKRCVVDIFDLTEDEWINLKSVLSEIIKIIENIDLKEVYQNFIDNPLNDKSINFCKKILNHFAINKKPDAYNIGINEGEAAGRTINHLHIHIIPRFHGDVKDSTGGIRNIIPGMGNYQK